MSRSMRAARRTKSRRKPIQKKLLKYVDKFDMPAFENAEITEQAVKDAGVVYLSDGCREEFLGKVESAKKMRLKTRRLRKDSRDKPIIKERGGWNKVEGTFTNFLKMLPLHAEVGTRLFGYIRGKSKIKGKSGTKWAVTAYRDGGGWYVHRRSVDGPRPWCAGRVLISR